jgi:F-type H+-transporting ATPase subunit b
VHALIATLIPLAQEVSDKKDIYPKLQELILGLVAFAILFVFMWRWVIPQVNKVLEARRDKIQGDLEKAEQTKGEAEKMLADYRQSLAGARDESNRIIEEARRTAESMRKDLQTKSEEEARQIVARAQDEIRAERDRVFQELRAQLGVLSVQLAERVVGQSLDRDRQVRLVDDYIDELTGTRSGNGDGHGPPGGAEE